MLEGRLDQSPFAKALKDAKLLLVVPTNSTSIYTRAWCVYEAFLGVQRGIDIELPAGLPMQEFIVIISPSILLFMISAVVSGVISHQFGFEELWDTNSMGPVASASFILMFFGFVVLQCCGVPPNIWLPVQFTGLGLMMGGSVSMSNYAELGIELQVWFVFTLAVVYSKLFQERVQAESVELAFRTVLDAHASSEADKRKIFEEIRSPTDRVDDVDNAISILKKFSRYNGAVKFNMQLGITDAIIRTGSRIEYVLLTVITWSAWWTSLLFPVLGFYPTIAAMVAVTGMGFAVMYNFEDYSLIVFFDGMCTGSLSFLMTHLPPPYEFPQQVALFLGWGLNVILATCGCGWGISKVVILVAVTVAYLQVTYFESKG